jgi:hypothetical protein
MVSREGIDRNVRKMVVIINHSGLTPNHGRAKLIMTVIGSRFVTRHQDLYYAAWVVHATNQPANSPDLAQTMAVVDCQIDVSKPVKNLTAN